MIRRLFLCLLLFSLCVVLDAQNKVNQFQYWFDLESPIKESTNVLDSGECNFSVDASGLAEGLHTFYYRIKDNSDNWSSLQSWLFFKQEYPKNGALKVTQGEYWIDSLYTQRVTENITDSTFSIVLDAKSLSEGIHTINYRFKDSENMYSATNSWLFTRTYIPRNKNYKVTQGEYWIDSLYSQRTSVNIEDSLFYFVYDASKLSEGIHTINYRLKDSEGVYNATQSWMFMRTALRDTTIINKPIKCEYWFDNNINSPYSVAMSDSTISFVADASALVDGAHILSYRIKDVLGNYTIPQSWMFFKNAQKKGTRIAWYKTWWNEHIDKAELVTIDIDTAEYTFEKQIEVPMYAKTDGYSRNSTARFNIVFGDDAGYMSLIESFNVKYQDNIPPVTTLEITEQSDEQIGLKWYADEDEIDFYNVYVSEDNKPFYLWMPNTTATSATFKRKDGVSYKFIATARDMAGNMEKYDEERCTIVK